MKMKMPHAYNSLFKMVLDQEFGNFLRDQRRFYEQSKNSIEISLHLRKFLEEKKISLAWETPLMNYIKTGIIDLPYDEGIMLKAGSDHLTHNTSEVFLMRDNKTGKIISHEDLSIVITAKTSIDRLLRFIKENKEAIEFWQNQIELPEIERPEWRDVDIAYSIILLRDVEKLSFAEIASKLAKNYESDPVRFELYSDEANIKNTYHRYKKQLGLK